MGLCPMHFNRQNSDVCRREWKTVEILNFAEKEQSAEAEHLHMAEKAENVEETAEKCWNVEAPV